jgi:hypothetical protein
MFALDVLGIAFPRVVSFRIEMPRVRPPMVRLITGNPAGLPQSLQRQKDFIFAATKDRGQDLAGVVMLGRRKARYPVARFLTPPV